MRDSWEDVLDASPPQISVVTQRLASGDWMVLVSGELDSFTASTFQRHLNGPLDDGDGSVLLDLSGLRFCDHAGLRMLRSVEIDSEPGRVRIVVSHPCVDLVMRLCGLEVLLGHRHKA